MGAFHGGIWDSNPFGRGGSRGGRQPRRSGYANQDLHGGYVSLSPMMGGMRGPGHTYGGMMGGPMTGGNSHSYSCYHDSDGNMQEECHGPNGSYCNSVRGVQEPGGMGMNMMRLGGNMGEGGMVPQGRRPRGSLLSGGRPGAFQSGFWTGGNPFRGVNGRAGGGQGLRPDSAFRFEMDPAPMPQDRGLGLESAEDMAQFMREHTRPVSDGGGGGGGGGANAPPNAECPICLEPPSASHLCVQITGIAGCNHLLGRDCLKEMLLIRPDDQKRCPICRAEFLGEAGIWQDSEEFQRLAQGQDAGGRGAPPHGFPPTYGGGDDGRPPRTCPHAAPPSLRNVHGMGDVGMGKDDEQDGGGPPAMDDRGPPPPPRSNFNGRGERIGYMYADQRW